MNAYNFVGKTYYTKHSYNQNSWSWKEGLIKGLATEILWIKIGQYKWVNKFDNIVWKKLIRY